MTTTGTAIQHRLQHLENHLEQENPVLLNTVQSFRELDAVAYRMGLFDPEQSYATQIPWWPLISVLGTFSAGKSTFVNALIGEEIAPMGVTPTTATISTTAATAIRMGLALRFMGARERGGRDA